MHLPPGGGHRIVDSKPIQTKVIQRHPRTMLANVPIFLHDFSPRIAREKRVSAISREENRLSMASHRLGDEASDPRPSLLGLYRFIDTWERRPAPAVRIYYLDLDPSAVPMGCSWSGCGVPAGCMVTVGPFSKKPTVPTGDGFFHSPLPFSQLGHSPGTPNTYSL